MQTLLSQCFNGREQQKTAEAEGDKQTQVAIATRESVGGRRRMKKEERETDSAEKRREEIRAAGFHGSQTVRTRATNEHV
jgi:hypothetical protein